MPQMTPFHPVLMKKPPRQGVSLKSAVELQMARANRMQSSCSLHDEPAEFPLNGSHGKDIAGLTISGELLR